MYFIHAFSINKLYYIQNVWILLHLTHTLYSSILKTEIKNSVIVLEDFFTACINMHVILYNHDVKFKLR